MNSLDYFGISDIGLVRPNNEDAWIAIPEIGFFALADGMGGEKAGEVAASKTIEHLCSRVKEMIGHGIKTWIDGMLDLRKAIEETNNEIRQMSRTTSELAGMGTTLCCILWIQDAVLYAHVGDSRIYRLRNEKLELLTRDHSFYAKWLSLGKKVETCQTPYPYKNVITRAIGITTKANPEIAYASLQSGDLFLLCTDGLSDALSLEEMEKILLTSNTSNEASENLIQRAKIKGGRDNMTALIIKTI